METIKRLLSEPWRLASLVMLATAPLTGLNAAEGEAGWPDKWWEMEIESKWTVEQDKFTSVRETLDSYVSSKATMFGYTVVRNPEGFERKYSDIYYDNAAGDLSNAGEVLRDRIRKVLQGGSFQQQDRRLQFKTAPIRLEAVWFRKEVEEDYNLNPINASLNNAAIAEIVRNHPSFFQSPVEEIFSVEDHRLRYMLLENGDDAFEVSLDSVVTNFPSGKSEASFEIEIENKKKLFTNKKGKRPERLIPLFYVSYLWEKEFGLTQSVASKGAVEIPSTGTYLEQAAINGTRGCGFVSSLKNSCFWMENRTGNYCWVNAPQGEITFSRCRNLDSCSGGGGASGGGCYKYSLCSDCKRFDW